MSINYDDPPEETFDDEIPPDDGGDDDVGLDDGAENENGEENLETSSQDPSKTTLPAKDPKALAPTEQPKLTPQEIEAKVAEYQAQLEALKPYQELNERVGSYEGIAPAVELFDMFTGGEFNAVQALDLMKVLNPEAVQHLGWQIVDTDRQSIVSDSQIRDAVFASDENYQRFLQWQQTGELPDEQNIDPNLKKVQDELAEFKRKEVEKEQVAAKAAEEAKTKATQERVSTYDNERLKFVDNQISQLNWGDEHKELAGAVKQAALASFNSDAQARSALDYARRLSLQSASNPKDQKVKALLNSATKRVENIFANKLKAVTTPINKGIQGNHSATQAARAKQQSKPVLGNNGGTITATDVLSGLADPYEKAKARLDAARAAGTVTGYAGY